VIRLLRFGTHQPHRHARGKQASGAADTAPILFSWAPAFALRHSQMSDSSRARATRALSRRARHEYRVSKHCRLTNYNLYAISANDQSNLFGFTRWRAPCAQGFLRLCLSGARPEQAVISLLFRSLRRRRPRLPAEKERTSLIIPCKNSKNSGGPFRRT
jgi:hypothetical protein